MREVHESVISCYTHAVEFDLLDIDKLLRFAALPDSVFLLLSGRKDVCSKGLSFRIILANQYLVGSVELMQLFLSFNLGRFCYTILLPIALLPILGQAAGWSPALHARLLCCCGLIADAKLLWAGTGLVHAAVHRRISSIAH